jgi:hypothetical protein
MTRTILPIAGLLILAVAACDKSASEAQERADKAQAKANTEITSAEVAASDKANRAQAEADKKIAQAQADFNKTSEDYRHQMQTNLDAVDKKLMDLDAKALAAAQATRADLTANSASLRAQRDAFANDFKSLDYATALTWDATRARVDKEWSDLRSAVDHAM